MSSAILRHRMNFPVSKKQTSPIKGTDLQKIWDSSSLSSQVSSSMASPSPPSSPSTPVAKKTQNILTLLSLNVNKAPKKKLYCPPVLDNKIEKKQKPRVPDSLFSSLTFTAKSLPEIDRELTNQFTYVFKGDKETQEDAWSSFKSVYKTARESVVMCFNITFYFANGKVTAKATTKSGEKHLETIFTEEPFVDEEKAVGLIDSLIRDEAAKLSIFSTVCFSYAVAYPIKVNSSEMGSRDGDLHRVAFSGYIFEEVRVKLEQLFSKCDASCFKVPIVK